ncbi:MAG: helix-turn-helix domain-containing protein [Bacteroidota bacterium]
MTNLGLYFAKKSINRADLGRKTGLTTNRLNNLVNSDKSVLTLEEFYLICLALELDPGEFIKIVCPDIELPNNNQ